MLNEKEIDTILKKTKNLREKILNEDDTFLNLTKINEKYFNDYSYHKRYFKDKEKISLYYSLVNLSGRKVNVKKPGWLGLFSLIYSFYVYLFNIPRLLKLKFLPGLGKQNYS